MVVRPNTAPQVSVAAAVAAHNKTVNVLFTLKIIPHPAELVKIFKIMSVIFVRMRTRILPKVHGMWRIFFCLSSVGQIARRGAGGAVYRTAAAKSRKNVPHGR